MINTHQELVLALSEAAELEHSLICQYLFAAYSLKSAADNPSSETEALCTRWREQILNVARQEMGHLGTVWNLQALVGAAPCVARANFPQSGGRYYPPAIDFSLTRFGEETLLRFIAFERPQQTVEFIALGAPDPLEYDRVGSLYAQIAQAARTMTDERVLINPGAVQDSDSWSNNVTLMAASTREQMAEAVDFIIRQGEGTPAATTGSHYAIFRQILSELSDHLAQGGEPPWRDVLPNPRLVPHRDAEGGSVVEQAEAAQTMAAFNLIYYVLLQLLRHYYGGGTASEDQRANLRTAAYKLMHNCLGPLGGLLTAMPATDDPAGPRAGPSFERYGVDDLSAVPAALWRISIGELMTARDALAELAAAGVPGLAPIVDGTQQTIEWLEADVPGSEGGP